MTDTQLIVNTVIDGLITGGLIFAALMLVVADAIDRWGRDKVDVSTFEGGGAWQDRRAA